MEAQAPVQRRRRLPGPTVWALIAALLATALGSFWTNWIGDHAVTNIVFLSLIASSMLVLGIWFFVYSSHPPARRSQVRNVLLGLLVVAVAILRPQRPTGDLWGFVRFVWQAPPAPPPPLTSEPQGTVDLSTTTPWDFPQYAGPQRNLQVANVQLEPDWQRQPPELLWRQPVGAGWSGFAAVNGFAVTMEQRGEREAVTCYEVASGRPMWSHSIDARHDTTMGRLGPRSTPTIHDGAVYALGATGVLRALRGSDGGLLWKVDLLREFGIAPDQDGEEVAWGRANSPLLVDGMVVVPAGGPQGGPIRSLAAFDAATGRRLWTGGEDQISYSSPIVCTLAGVRQIVSVNESTVSGHRPQDGRQLWSVDWASSSSGPASTSQPMPIDDRSLLISKGYSQGAARIRLSRQQDELQAEFQWKAPKVMKTKLTSAIVSGDFAYGLSDGILQCIELDEGRLQWKSERLKHGQPLLVGDLLLVMAEWGELRLYRATAQRPELLGALPDALDGTAWNTLCLHGLDLLVRSQQEAACYRLPGKLK